MRRSLYARGALSGLCGGIAFLAIALIARTPLPGLVVHTFLAALFGAGFGRVFYGLDRSTTVAAGLLWGLMIWLPMYFLILPLLGLSAVVRATPTAVSLLEHIAFGGITGAAFAFIQRDFGERAWDRKYSWLWDARP